MEVRPRLLTPGPVELHPKARAALVAPQVHHRTAVARERFTRARALLAEAFRTQGEVLILTGSGTAAMEALATNLFAPGERVYVPVLGKFSERWAEIAKSAGLEVVRRGLEWGRVLVPESLEADLRAYGPVSGVLLTHSETSTGALNDVRVLAEVVRRVQPQALVVIDAVTSLLVSPLELDAWGIDAAASGSQKGLMCPPGLAFAALGPRALARLRPRGYYLNLERELKAQRTGESAYTPAINLVLAAEAVLEEVVPRLEAHLALKAEQHERLYALGAELGLKPVPERRSAATAAFWLPEGVRYPEVREAFARRGAVIAGGQGPLKGRIFRVSLMGYFDRYDTEAVLALVRAALVEVLRA
ncbi:pyridoxal-phosphate-dependent aminotransferase family protein [Marinithermus hydrothermalis]|uniref:Alanine--glyoxylate transaminase n=1 Tax=Marinithermus hydrothermalis (strain DSM 14884 / JCM 11576 / T1) TaxID=869210 RepID=F2NPA8_MARHT|nr:alanine--glyoxylate aminotransferase family protein [Marinithermus hydrothermalis]AEB11909.1 Alanine--glyoxylate transaminase [Marinithermus hydrothermalis DSM 14884]